MRRDEWVSVVAMSIVITVVINTIITTIITTTIVTIMIINMLCSFVVLVVVLVVVVVVGISIGTNINCTPPSEPRPRGLGLQVLPGADLHDTYFYVFVFDVYRRTSCFIVSLFRFLFLADLYDTM